MTVLNHGNNAARGEAIIAELDDFLAEMYTKKDAEKLRLDYGTDMITDEQKAAMKRRHLQRLGETSLEHI